MYSKANFCTPDSQLLESSMTENNDFKLDWQTVKSYISNKDNLRKIITTLIPYIVIYAIFLYVMNYFDISVESVREFFAGKGLVLVPIFILVQLVASLTPLPDLPFIAAGILFFQPWATFILIWIGMWLGSLINFYIARRLGRNLILNRYPQTTEWIDKFTGKYGFETVVVARAFTFVTFDLVAYAAGVSNMKFRAFAIASVFGIIPVALNATLVGLAITSQDVGRGVLLFILSAVLALVLGWLASKYRGYLESKNGSSLES